MGWLEDAKAYSGTESVKCPNCAANIFYNEQVGKLVCHMCGGLYEPKSLRPLGRIENRDVDKAGDKEGNKNEFVCDSCGAAVVTDYNTAATFCAFCGSPTLIKRRLSKSFRPDYIIPFTVSKEEAIENFKKWAKTHKGIPKEFVSDATLTKITGYYVPFWLINADCNAEVGGLGQTAEAHFNIDRRIKFRVRKVPFDGCKKIPNTLMEAIEPFDFDKLEEYNDMYLPGFYAQRYDMSALDMIDLIKIRIDTYAAGLVKHFTTNEYDKVSVGATGSFSENFSQNYALLPVWFLNVKYEGANYGIAVNGQTGEASGNLPIKKSRVYLHSFQTLFKYILKYLVVTSVFGLVFSVPSIAGLLDSDFGPDNIAYGIGFCLMWFLVAWTLFSLFGLTVFIPFAVREFRSKRFNESVTLDKAPEVEHYIDYNGKFEMEKNDSFAFCATSEEDEHSRKNKSNNLLTLVLKMIFK